MATQDYRVSTIVVLCKDCGNDVGHYPAQHRCAPVERPPMPSMPSIPLKYQQQQQPSSYGSRTGPSSQNNRHRPPDLSAGSLTGGSGGASSYSGGSASSLGAYGSRTPTSASSFQDRMNGSSSRTPTASSFQERMKERDREKVQREREERDAAARGLREDAAGPSSTATTAPTAAPAATTGTTLWNRLLAAKEVINATITGEEKWPESDDSDYEGESHVSRILREHADKKEEEELAAKIAELETTPYTPGSRSTEGNSSRNPYIREPRQKEPAPSIVSSTSSGEDHYGRSLRARGGEVNGGTNGGSSSSGSRYRAASDASRDDALSRLEGKSQGDRLAAQVSHLGSTSPRGARANSPNVGHRQLQQEQSIPIPPQPTYRDRNQLSPSANGGQNYSSSAPSQRSISPASARRYDSPSPSSSSSSLRYAGARHQPPQSSSSSSSLAYRQQASSPSPSPSRGDASGSSRRPEYERRPTFPPNGQASSSSAKDLGAYGQRQQQQQQQQYNAYGASKGDNYF